MTLIVGGLMYAGAWLSITYSPLGRRLTAIDLSRSVTTLPGKQHDLHGSAPDTHRTALLLIDVINDFEFPRGEDFLRKLCPSRGVFENSRGALPPPAYPRFTSMTTSGAGNRNSMTS